MNSICMYVCMYVYNIGEYHSYCQWRGILRRQCHATIPPEHDRTQMMECDI